MWWIQILTGLGFAAVGVVLLLFWNKVLKTEPAAEEETPTRNVPQRPEIGSIGERSSEIEAIYRGATVIVTFCESKNVDSDLEIVDTSLYDEKGIIGLTYFSPEKDRQELIDMIKEEVGEEIDEEILKAELSKPYYSRMDNVDVIHCEDGTWLWGV